jgi:hypothetical protein
MSRGICARSYIGLLSGSCCSGISLLCLLYACMYIDSQISILVPFWQCFSNCSVVFAVPYSCLLCKMCVAQADVRLVRLIYLICSVCLVFIDYLSVRYTPSYMYCNLFYILQMDHYSWDFMRVVEISYLWF